MGRLTPVQLDGRRELDFDVLMAIHERCDLVEVEAYATAADLKAGKNRITDPAQGRRAKHYKITYYIRTLVGPGQYVETTIIHVDTELSSYPYVEPASWVLSKVPWSPHFKAGAVVCTGDHWRKDGKSLLGHLVRHHAKLLNWDEQARGGGYRGWNGPAIDWHRANYGTKPLTEGLRYPELPIDITHGIDGDVVDDAPDLFGEGSRNGAPPYSAAGPDLFGAGVRR